MEGMWKEVRRLCPTAKCFQLMGNHDVRVSKRISEKLPELSELFSHTSLYNLPGVNVLESDRDYLELDGVVYVHGWLTKSLDHAKFFGMPTVHGHRHRPCLEYSHGRLWSMDCGHLSDLARIPMQYTQSKKTNWTLACGLVEERQPRLFILE